MKETGSTGLLRLPRRRALFKGSYSWILPFLLTLLLAFLPLLLGGGSLAAQSADQLIAFPFDQPSDGGGTIELPPLLAQMAILVGLSLMPFLVLLLTSFTKMVIVLGLLRSALGVQQAPPNQVINGIALILSIYVMYPTGYAMYQRVEHLVKGDLTTELVSRESAEFILMAAAEAREPLRAFLIRNSRPKYRQSFFRIAHGIFPKEKKGELKSTDFIVVIPAYITSQIEDAFQIGVLIYLPFFVIDIVTSNILLAMGMMMLSPMTISLPLKLLLVVMLDGWSLLLEGLTLSYKS